MAWKSKLPSIVIGRNKHGVALGVEIDGQRIPLITKLGVDFDIKSGTRLKLEIVAQNIKFKDLDTETTFWPKEESND